MRVYALYQANRRLIWVVIMLFIVRSTTALKIFYVIDIEQNSRQKLLLFVSCLTSRLDEYFWRLLVRLT